MQYFFPPLPESVASTISVFNIAVCSSLIMASIFHYHGYLRHILATDT